MNMTDYDLLARYVHQKDNTAFAHLVVRHTPLVRGIATRWLGHPTGSDDISQTVFATLAGQSLPVLAGLHSKGSLSPWLCRVTANAALQVRRAERRRQRRETRSARSVWIPAEQQSDTEALQTLQEELHALPVEIQEPLVLCYLEGRTQQRAAAILNVSQTTLKRRLQAGLCRLRQRLGQRGLTLPALAAWLISFESQDAIGQPTASGSVAASHTLLATATTHSTRAASLALFAKATAASCLLAPILALAVWAAPPTGDLAASSVSKRPAKPSPTENEPQETRATLPEDLSQPPEPNAASVDPEGRVQPREDRRPRPNSRQKPAPKQRQPRRGNAGTSQPQFGTTPPDAGGPSSGTQSSSNNEKPFLNSTRGSQSGSSGGFSGSRAGGSSRSSAMSSANGFATGISGGSARGSSGGSSGGRAGGLTGRSGGTNSSATNSQSRDPGRGIRGMFENRADVPSAEELLQQLQREMNIPALREGTTQSRSFHGSLSVNGETREYDNEEEYEAAKRKLGLP